ncbi:MAG: hypothetical protein M1825_001835 [Sarcosagium campestre]|nr:MAG: hypothetical protein M1825_001835 [Sarcosagium campestre]
MYSLEVIRASNAAIKNLPPGLVALFVGATSGIGASALKQFVKNARSPRVYFVGRNETAASQLKEVCKGLNPDAAVTFFKADASLLSNVDNVCQQVKAREKYLNLLFLSAGFLTLKGRNESPEGIDRKLAVHYYGRIRFVQQLLPLLESASDLARVVSILGTSREAELIEDDLELKNNFSLRNCEVHAITMKDLTFEFLAKQHPTVGFVHSIPGMVNTNILGSFPLPVRILGSGLFFVAKPWFVPLDESGERHVFQGTSAAFRQADAGSGKAGVPLAEGVKPAKGAGSVEGAGVYMVNWKGDAVAKEQVLQPYRARGYEQEVWKHTLDVFDRARNSGLAT